MSPFLARQPRTESEAAAAVAARDEAHPGWRLVRWFPRIRAEEPAPKLDVRMLVAGGSVTP